ncbi:uncharacterized protein PF3D7_1120600 isoform X3 [Parasteatoda tepidariorum]|uniref:uncharacterized protein PF3D7_1120600 isoform X3 n=1 Tax=Parasteatoda tepidariorum TaxID=114398 RepID=UPI001C71AEF5|nr:uncharacterized protein LOC107438204 isoform X3 [Parasteatoda tepidariorum]
MMEIQSKEPIVDSPCQTSSQIKSIVNLLDDNRNVKDSTLEFSSENENINFQAVKLALETDIITSSKDLHCYNSKKNNLSGQSFLNDNSSDAKVKEFGSNEVTDKYIKSKLIDTQDSSTHVREVINLESSDDEELYYPNKLDEKSIDSNVVDTKNFIDHGDVKQIVGINLQSVDDEDQFLYGYSDPPLNEVKTRINEKKTEIFLKSNWSDDDEFDQQENEGFVNKLELKVSDNVDTNIVDHPLLQKNKSSLSSLSLTPDAKTAVNKFINGRAEDCIFSKQVKINAERKANLTSSSAIWSDDDEYEIEFFKNKLCCDNSKLNEKSSSLKVNENKIAKGILKKIVGQSEEPSLLSNNIKEANNELGNNSKEASEKDEAMCRNENDLSDEKLKIPIQSDPFFKVKSKWENSEEENETECNTLLLNAMISSKTKQINQPSKLSKLSSSKNLPESGQNNSSSVISFNPVMIDDDFEKNPSKNSATESSKKNHKYSVKDCDKKKFLKNKNSSKAYDHQRRLDHDSNSKSNLPSGNHVSNSGSYKQKQIIEYSQTQSYWDEQDFYSIREKYTNYSRGKTSTSSSHDRHCYSPFRRKGGRPSISPPRHRSYRQSISPPKHRSYRQSISPPRQRSYRHSRSPIRRYSRCRSRSPKYYRSSYSSKYSAEGSPHNFSYNRKRHSFRSSDSESLSDFSFSSSGSYGQQSRNRPFSRAKNQTIRKKSITPKKNKMKSSSRLNKKLKQFAGPIEVLDSSKAKVHDIAQSSNLINCKLMQDVKEVELLKKQRTGEQNIDKENSGSVLSSKVLPPEQVLPAVPSSFPDSQKLHKSYSKQPPGSYYNIPCCEDAPSQTSPKNLEPRNCSEYHSFSPIDNAVFPTAENKHSTCRKVYLKSTPRNNLVQISTKIPKKDKNCKKTCKIAEPVSQIIEETKLLPDLTNAACLRDSKAIDQIIPSSIKSNFTYPSISISKLKESAVIYDTDHTDQKYNADVDFYKKNFKGSVFDEKILKKALSSIIMNMAETRNFIKQIENKKNTSKSDKNVLSSCKKFIVHAEKQRNILLGKIEQKCEDLETLQNMFKKEDLKALGKEIETKIGESSFIPRRTSTPIKFAAYDAQHHWCDFCCKEFITVGEILTHFYSSEHLKSVDPCHPINFKEPVKEVIESDYVLKPIKGVEFVKPHHSFYCTLCNESLLSKSHAHQHLKGHTHTFNYYMHYNEENPTYDMFREVKKTLYKHGLIKNTKQNFAEKRLTFGKRRFLYPKADGKQANILVDNEKSTNCRIASRKKIDIKIKNRPMIGQMPNYKSRANLKKILIRKEKVGDKISLTEKNSQNNEVCKNTEENQFQKAEENNVLERSEVNALFDEETKAHNETSLIKENVPNKEMCMNSEENQFQKAEENNDLEKSEVKALFDEETKAHNETSLTKENVPNNEMCMNLEENLLQKREENCDIFLEESTVNTFAQKTKADNKPSLAKEISHNYEILKNTKGKQLQENDKSDIYSLKSEVMLIEERQNKTSLEQKLPLKFSPLFTQCGKMSSFHLDSQENKAENMFPITPEEEAKTRVDLSSNSFDLNNPLSSSPAQVLSHEIIVDQPNSDFVQTTDIHEIQVNTEKLNTKMETEINVPGVSPHSFKRKYSACDSIERDTKKLAISSDSENGALQNIASENQSSFEATYYLYCRDTESQSSQLNTAAFITNKSSITESETLLDCEKTLTSCIKYKLPARYVINDIFGGRNTSSFRVKTQIDKDFQKYTVQSQKVLTSIINMVAKNIDKELDTVKIKNNEATSDFKEFAVSLTSVPDKEYIEEMKSVVKSHDSSLPISAANDVLELKNDIHFSLKTKSTNESIAQENSEYVLREGNAELKDVSLVDVNLADCGDFKGKISNEVQEILGNLINKLVSDTSKTMKSNILFDKNENVIVCHSNQFFNDAFKVSDETMKEPESSQKSDELKETEKLLASCRKCSIRLTDISRDSKCFS